MHLLLFSLAVTQVLISGTQGKPQVAQNEVSGYESCQDIGPSCSVWGHQCGSSTDPRYRDEWCRKTCGTCGPDTPRVTSDCSVANATNIGGKCLTFSEDRLNWHEAVSACTIKGGQLATLQGKKVPELLHDYILDNHSDERFWLGGSDIAIEGHWEWLDGQPFREFPWPRFLPDNWTEDGQHCLTWGWNQNYDDQGCSKEYRYICELV